MGNPLQQLDLFGMPVENSTAPKPKKLVIKKTIPSIEAVTEVQSITQPAPVITKKSPSENKIKVAGKRGRKSFKEMDAVADLIEIPDEEILKQKLYYSISEVASWFKVNTSLLRYWENEFDILQPRKTSKGDRLFRVEDIRNLQLIYLLLRQKKFSIEGAKNYLKNNSNKINTETQLVQSLNKFKQFLLELKSSLSN